MEKNGTLWSSGLNFGITTEIKECTQKIENSINEKGKNE